MSFPSALAVLLTFFTGVATGFIGWKAWIAHLVKDGVFWSSMLELTSYSTRMQILSEIARINERQSVVGYDPEAGP